LLRSISELESKYLGLFGKREDNDEPLERNNNGTERERFVDFWGWIHIIKEVAQANRITEDEVHEWGVIRLLNELAYLKDKNKMEAEELERQRRNR
jgi:hypothetical protein